MPLPLDVFVVPHTHWDREWYHSAARFQTRLVSLIDALFDAPVDAARPFLLDGQMVVIDDYLSVRPERERDMARALQSGALEAGPWYVLADNLIPSGEAIIRNLEAGRRRLRQLGATAPSVAYCPDTFGHPAALPLIAAGFGLTSAIVWRGFGGASFPATDIAWWESGNGNRVLLHHLSPDGYEFGSALPIPVADAKSRWQHIAATLRARNRTGVALLLSGADHHAAQPDFAPRVAALNVAAMADRASAQCSGLSRAVGALWSAAMADSAVPVVRGELRDSYGYTWTLAGTLATRAQQKRRNAVLERALLHDVEPWGVLAWLHALPTFHCVAATGATTLAQLPVLTQHTWVTLLRTHPHDSLCGCSTDDVAAAVTARQRRVHSVLPELRLCALQGALQHDGVAARARGVESSPVMVVRNGVGRARHGIAEVAFFETIRDVGVGPRSAGETGSDLHGDADRQIEAKTAPITAASVPSIHECVVQVVSTRVTHMRRESPQHYPDNDQVRVHRALAWVPDVPALGVRVLQTGPNARSVPSLEVPATVRRTDTTHVLNNGQLQVEVSRHGVTVVRGTRRITQALQLHTTTDLGDSYTPSLREAAQPLRIVKIRPRLRGPLRASVRVEWRWNADTENIRVVTELSLDANADHVRCEVHGMNGRRNHRLQLVWRTDVANAKTTVDAAFGPVSRLSMATVSNAVPFELPPTTMPLHRWMTTHNTTHGATVISDGLAEGEAADNYMAITLVRAIGELSRANLPERPGHAGWPVATPRAQCQGRFAARCGLLLHGPWSDAVHQLVRETADAMLVPLVGESWRDMAGASRELSGPVLAGTDLSVSAVHIHETGTCVVLRACNNANGARQGTWTLPDVGPFEYQLVRLDGTPDGDSGDSGGMWTACDRSWTFDIGPRAVVTYQVRRSA